MPNSANIMPSHAPTPPHSTRPKSHTWHSHATSAATTKGNINRAYRSGEVRPPIKGGGKSWLGGGEEKPARKGVRGEEASFRFWMEVAYSNSIRKTTRAAAWRRHPIRAFSPPPLLLFSSAEFRIPRNGLRKERKRTNCGRRRGRSKRKGENFFTRSLSFQSSSLLPGLVTKLTELRCEVSVPLNKE